MPIPEHREHIDENPQEIEALRELHIEIAYYCARKAVAEFHKRTINYSDPDPKAHENAADYMVESLMGLVS